jgi:hypothetical protein
MRKADITGIHRILTRYYGSRHMSVLTNVEKRVFINPCDISIEFDYDSSIEIDYMLLLKRLRRYIIHAEFFVNIIREELKIKIYVMLYDKPQFDNYDFEFSQN